MVDDWQGYALAGADTDHYRLLRTDDGGHTWTDATPPGIHPSAVLADNGEVIVAAARRTGVFVVERSADGGRSWTASSPFRDAHGGGIGAPQRIDARHLVVAIGEGAAAGSEAQALYASDDGGARWRFVSRTDTTGRRPGALPFGCDKDGVGFATPLRGWAGGYCAGGKPFFFRTGDGGRTWRRAALPGLAACACDVSPPTDGAVGVVGFTMGGKPLVRAYWLNGGVRWRGGGPAGAGRASGNVAFAGARVAWVAATPRGRIKPPFDLLFRTTDAGRTWAEQRLPFDADGYQLDPVDGAVAFAVNGSSSLRATADGGRTWHTLAARLR